MNRTEVQIVIALRHQMVVQMVVVMEVKAMPYCVEFHLDVV